MMLTAAKLALAPLLIVQGRRVRRIALQLPEACGPSATAWSASALPVPRLPASLTRA